MTDIDKELLDAISDYQPEKFKEILAERDARLAAQIRGQLEAEQVTAEFARDFRTIYEDPDKFSVANGKIRRYQSEGKSLAEAAQLAGEETAQMFDLHQTDDRELSNRSAIQEMRRHRMGIRGLAAEDY